MLLYLYRHGGFIMCIAICYIEEMKNALSKALSHLLRKTKGATQVKVGLHAGISQPYVSDLKNGDRDGGLELWEKIAEYFGMEYDEFYAFGKKIVEYDSNIIGGTQPRATSSPAPCPACGDIQNQKQKHHHQIIDNFHNHELAVEINQLLVQLEKLESDDGLKAALEWAKYRVHEAEKKRGLTTPANGTEGN